MKRLGIILLTCIVVALPFAGLLAQPDMVTRALADLNTRLGTTLTLVDLDDWRWSENVYDDASLGCTLPGTSAAQVVTIGYSVLLTYQGTIYDYRADNAGTLFLCTTSTSSIQTPAVPTATLAAPSDEVISAANAAGMEAVARVEAAGRPLLAWSPDSRQIAVAAEELPTASDAPTNGVLLYDAAAPNSEPILLQYPVPVTALAYGSDERGDYLVTGHDDGSVLVTPSAGGESQALAVDSNAAIAQVAVSADGTRIAALTHTPESIYVWDAATGSVLAVYSSDTPLTTLAFSVDGQTLAFADARGTLSFAAPGAVEGVAFSDQVGFGPILALAFDPSDANMLAVGSEDGNIRLWELDGRSVAAVMDNATDDSVATLSYNSDGTLLASSGGTIDGPTRDNSIRLWSTETFTTVKGLFGHDAAVRVVAFSPDNTRIASVSDDGTLRLWAVAEASG